MIDGSLSKDARFAREISNFRKSGRKSVYGRELHSKVVLTGGPPSQNSITPRPIKLPCSKK